MLAACALGHPLVWVDTLCSSEQVGNWLSFVICSASGETKLHCGEPGLGMKTSPDPIASCLDGNS